MSHKHHYEWVRCARCEGHGLSMNGNTCRDCRGKGKRSECANCEAEYRARIQKQGYEERELIDSNGELVGVQRIPVYGEHPDAKKIWGGWFKRLVGMFKRYSA
jgi:hypothetical protein